MTFCHLPLAKILDLSRVTVPFSSIQLILFVKVWNFRMTDIYPFFFLWVAWLVVVGALFDGFLFFQALSFSNPRPTPSF